VRASTPEHWQRFWEQADDIQLDEVYGTDGRMVREVMRLGDPAGKRILEVGAGTGRDAVALAEAGADVLTLDYVHGSLGLTLRAADAAGVTVDPVCGDALGSPFADGTFDVVFHQGLLEHFRDRGPLLRDNIRILKPGGHVIIDVPQTFHYYTLGKKALIAVDRWFAAGRPSSRSASSSAWSRPRARVSYAATATGWCPACGIAPCASCC